jgi:polysaccharide export outer membrane protein
VSALVFAGLSACAAPKYANDGSVARVNDLASVGEPTSVGTFEAARPFRFGPLDKMTYTVFGLEDFKGEIQIDSGGRISIPLAGSIVAAGLTPVEVGDRIASGLRTGGVRNPVVSVNATEINSQTVTVEGSVTQPGIYPIQPDMTLQRAIASARGLTEFGSTRNVVIFREVDGRRYAALYNLQAIRQGAYGDPRIYANDIVAVDESRSKRLFRDAVQAAPGILAPLVVLATR